MENIEPIKQILNELFSLLETLETQNGALLAYLKDRKLVNDKKLAPFLDQAGNAASVRWRAARARMEHLLAPPPKKTTEEKPASAQPEGKPGESSEKAREAKTSASDGKDEQSARQPSRIGAVPASPEPSDAKTKDKSQDEPQDKPQAKSQEPKPEQKQKVGETLRQPDKK